VEVWKKSRAGEENGAIIGNARPVGGEAERLFRALAFFRRLWSELDGLQKGLTPDPDFDGLVNDVRVLDYETLISRLRESPAVESTTTPGSGVDRSE